MLVLVDSDRSIKVFRLEGEEGNFKRVRVGAVQKNKLEPPQELLDALSPEEIAELNGAVEHYGGIPNAQIQLDVARFPEIVRNIVTHMSNGKISPAEHKLLATALTEGLRLLRKRERDAA